MAFVFACELPDHLWYRVDQDVWLEDRPDGTVRLGMTDPAQTRAGKLLYLRVRANKSVRAGQSVATVESGKWVGPVPAPLPGSVVDANPAVLEDPSLVNRDPYGEGWLLTFRPDLGREAWAASGLRHGPDAVDPYRAKLKEEGLTCMRCADPIP
ncbi:MAG: glycine cleavage system protein H [Thermaerobacter sp.]|nr:glycine cleavage system protein H [Thermaerobacter sp.]